MEKENGILGIDIGNYVSIVAVLHSRMLRELDEIRNFPTSHPLSTEGASPGTNRWDAEFGLSQLLKEVLLWPFELRSDVPRVETIHGTTHTKDKICPRALDMDEASIVAATVDGSKQSVGTICSQRRSF